jgi:hypothetical protein
VVGQNPVGQTSDLLPEFRSMLIERVRLT